MGTLLDFLIENPVDEIEEVRIAGRNGRLKDQVFKVRSLTSAEYGTIQKNCTTVKRKGITDFDSIRFARDCVTTAVVEPNFRDAEAWNKAGCVTLNDFVDKLLLPGEVQALNEKILIISGFNAPMEDLVDEVKNS